MEQFATRYHVPVLTAGGQDGHLVITKTAVMHWQVALSVDAWALHSGSFPLRDGHWQDRPGCWSDFFPTAEAALSAALETETVSRRMT